MPVEILEVIKNVVYNTKFIKMNKEKLWPRVPKKATYNSQKLFLSGIQTNNQKAQSFFPQFYTHFQTKLRLRNGDSSKVIASEWGAWKLTQVV